MSDQYDDLNPNTDDIVETTSTSWLEKISNRFKSIFIGLLLVVASIGVIFWNEGRSAETLASLNEGARIVVSISTDKIDSANDGKLVHVAGESSITQPVRDSDFGFSFNGLKVLRHVQMYQWKETTKSETQKKLGGGEETITRTSYALGWSETAINSNNFKNASDHKNPPFPAFSSKTFVNDSAKIGAFTLGPILLDELKTYDKANLADVNLNGVKSKLGPKATLAQGAVFVGNDPNTPALGDVLVQYQLIPVAPVSLIAKQFQSGFIPYVMSNGHKLLLIETGLKDSDLLIKDGKDDTVFLTWVIRVAAFFTMLVGFASMLSLFEALADVVPFFGDLVGAGTLIIAFCLTIITAPIVAAMAWVFYRPLIGGAMLAVGVVLFFTMRLVTKKRN